MNGPGRPLRVFMVAGEHSGDQLAGRLIPEIRRQAGRAVEFTGVGGESMAGQGCESLFPLADLAVMGPRAILAQLPVIVRRVYQTVAAAVAFRPDVLVILDSPEFTHPVARRVRKRMPGVPIVNYVSPSVWAWRPGRAVKMRRYVDHVLALLPFEPETHRRLGGPDCTYVGHPLIEHLDWIESLDPEDLARKLQLPRDRPVLVVLPGSRSNEVRRLMAPFGETIARLRERTGPFEVVVPAVASMREQIEARAADWPLRPHIVEGEEAKFQAFRLARAALAASGTVTLELALSGAPMVVAYKLEGWFAELLRHRILAPSIVLPNLILEENAFPEFIQERCTPENLTDALEPLLGDGPERRRQLDAIAGLAGRMRLDEGTPSGRAAGVILDLVKRRDGAA